jgi:hypothetical protein
MNLDEHRLVGWRIDLSILDDERGTLVLCQLGMARFSPALAASQWRPMAPVGEPKLEEEANGGD